MNKLIWILASSMLSWSVSAQDHGVTHSGQSTNQPPFPLESYTELQNPVKTDPQKWQAVEGVNLSWGTIDERYKKEVPPAITRKVKTVELTAWRGERVSAQWVAWSGREVQGLEYAISDLQHKDGSKITREDILGGFVRYVMTDELNKDGRGGCGVRPDSKLWDSTLVADPIDHITPRLNLAKHSTQGGWLRVWIPEDAHVGVYSGVVSFRDQEGELGTLNLRVKVLDRTLPAPTDWAFHLDLWQNPFAVARYHQVEPWSEEHFRVMRPYMEMYRDAGGKVITTSIMHKPWNAQTHDYFETMVTWMRKVTGEWVFDYTIFDRWVEFMMSLGIDSEINCYSMVPWKLTFKYFDQATNSMKEIEMKPGDEIYDEVWGSLLRSFSKHLREKGWFEITHISMDERPVEVMQRTLAIIRNADPEFKVSLAGIMHDDLLYEIDDYCVSLRMKFTEEALKTRKKNGQITAFYTCCEEPYPNTFTFSQPAEGAWMGWYASKAGLDGYLRWAYNSWVIEPLLDSRFYTWAAGDTYLVYPGARTSIRFERLVEGIQAFEKVRILREEYQRTGNRGGLKRLEKALNLFDEKMIPQMAASEMVRRANQAVNR